MIQAHYIVMADDHRGRFVRHDTSEEAMAAAAIFIQRGYKTVLVYRTFAHCTPKPQMDVEYLDD